MSDSQHLVGRLGPSSLRILIVPAAALVAVGVLAATSSSNQVRARTTGAREVVAVVQSASGSHLSVRRAATGQVVALHRSDKIYFGDTVTPGRGATATFKATVPKGISPDTELFYVKPVARTPHTVTLRGAGNTVEVTLGP